MSKSIIIIGAGKGISQAVAQKFGDEGYRVGLINRDPTKIEPIVAILKNQGIEVHFATADVKDTFQLTSAIQTLQSVLGSINSLVYNAALIQKKNILEEDANSLLESIKVNVGGALESIKVLLPELKKENGSILITGGGLSIHPVAAYGSLAIGKAGVRNLALQLHDELKPEVYVGTVTVNGFVSPESELYNPENLARLFWELHTKRIQPEIVI